MESKKFERGANAFLKPIKAQSEAESKQAEALNRLLDIQNKVRDYASQDVVFSPSLVSYRYSQGLNNIEIPIITKDALTFIQGKTGSHKSRLAEVFAGLLLGDGSKDIFGFRRYRGAGGYVVGYIDTERTYKEEFPAAIQHIRRLAGCNPKEVLRNLYETSIKGEARADRLEAVKAWIQYTRDDMQVRGISNWNLVIIIDVLTDAVSDWNDSRDSSALFDYLNQLCEKYSVSFVLVIHENPGSQKARGHLGTEGGNKASTQLSISVDKDSSGQRTGLLKIEFLKTRREAEPNPVYVEFSKNEKTLVAADKEKVKQVLAEKFKAGNLETAAEAISRIMAGRTDIKHKELIAGIIEELGVSERTARIRVGDVITGEIPIEAAGGIGKLVSDYQRGKETVYRIALPSSLGETSENTKTAQTVDFIEDVPF